MMKALSIRQPWAKLICEGMKNIENRKWSTDFRGRVYVHASKTFDESGCLYYKILVAKKYKLSLSYGAIIGEVDIVSCTKNYPSIWAIPGQWHFVLDNPVLYNDPIPCKGKLGFFEPDIDILVEIRKQDENSYHL